MTDVSDASITSAAAPVDARQKELLAAYVGIAWEDYEKTYRRLIEKKSLFSWSWLLFFFPWMWLTHRKMYLLGIAVWVLDVLPRPAGRWIAAATLLAHLAVAAFGKAYFLKRGLREVERVRASAASHQAALDAVKDGGIASGFGLFGVAIPLLVIWGMIFTYDG
jgi:hypothetical protein